MPAWVVDLLNRLNSTFVVDGRWQWFVSGLGYTLLISLFSVLLGLVIGILMALMRLSKSKILRAVSGIYIDIIRGTPTTVQLLIMWSGILATCKNSVLIASLTFGINSGAYVAEIVRAGILAVDKGQMEAGRSLGLNKFQTMRYIIIPQAFKSILPPLGNEFIVLIKETSIIGYIGMMDLTKGAMLIQSRTYNAFWPLMAAAAIYLVIVGILTWGMNKLERRLRESDIR